MRVNSEINLDHKDIKNIMFNSSIPSKCLKYKRLKTLMEIKCFGSLKDKVIHSCMHGNSLLFFCCKISSNLLCCLVFQSFQVTAPKFFGIRISVCIIFEPWFSYNVFHWLVCKNLYSLLFLGKIFCFFCFLVFLLFLLPS